MNGALARGLKALARGTRRLREGVIHRLLATDLDWPRLWPERPSSDRAEVSAHIDGDFYRRQWSSRVARRAAARHPGLHYWLVGRQRGFSPAPGFDPLFYRRLVPDLATGRDAYAHYLAQGRAAGLAANHVAARPGQCDMRRGRALLINHARGGGSTRYLGLYGARLQAEGFGLIEAVRAPGAQPLVSVMTGGRFRAFDLVADPDAMVAFARSQGVTRLVFNHLIDLPEPDAALGLAGLIGVDYEILLHDYFLACPRVDLVGADGRYCGLAETYRCRVCLQAPPAVRAPASAGVVDPDLWRARSETWLAGAVRVTAPSTDLARRLSSVFPALTAEVWEPEDDSRLPPFEPPRLGPDQTLIVAILGGLNRAKGYDVVANLARRLARNPAPIKIVVVGETIDTPALTALGVSVTGRYRENELDERLDRIAPHMFLFPAIWPETWSFTLTLALARGRPVMAFDIGAIGERLRRLGGQGLLPYALTEDAAGLAAALLAQRAAWVRDTQSTGSL